MQSRKQLEELAEALGGLPVFGCLPGSAAEHAGLRYGDIVLSVNGTLTPDLQTYVDARDGADRVAEIVVFRSGREKRISIPIEPAEPQQHEKWSQFAFGDGTNAAPPPSRLLN